MRQPSIAELVARHRGGHALEQGFYLREDVFQRDLDMVLGRWTCAGHASSLADAGDWLAIELGAESAILARGEDGRLRAFANVCRHRGSRICPPGLGHAPILTCPYHAWSYNLDGSLRAAREMGPDFDPGHHALQPLPLEVIGGVILISFAPDPPALEAAAPALADLAGAYDWASARIAARKTYEIAANWKLAMENYHECYHCALAHPEFSSLHTLARPKAQRAAGDAAWLAGLAAAGVALEEREVWSGEPDGAEVGRLVVSTLTRGAATGSRTGGRLAPPMGEAGKHEGGCAFAEVGMLSAFLAYPDHGLIYRFVPREARRTQLEVLWLVDGAAVEGRDYDVEDLTWLWDATSLADKRIIEMNQAGVASRAYRPGPFSPMESGTRAYVERYLGELLAAELAAG